MARERTLKGATRPPRTAATAPRLVTATPVDKQPVDKQPADKQPADKPSADKQPVDKPSADKAVPADKQ